MLMLFGGEASSTVNLGMSLPGGVTMGYIDKYWDGLYYCRSKIHKGSHL